MKNKFAASTFLLGLILMMWVYRILIRQTLYISVGNRNQRSFYEREKLEFDIHLTKDGYVGPRINFTV